MTGERSAATARLVRFVLCVATLAMLAGSWPLWSDDAAWSRVPFLLAWTIMAPPARALRIGLVIALILAAIGQAPRRSLAVALILMVGLILGDQHRFQPWAYQFLLIGSVLAMAHPVEALAFARGCLIVLYVHSALSKIDLSFCDELGLTFLQAGLGPFGLHPETWPRQVRLTATLAMPTAELVVAAALIRDRTRKIGLIGAIALHVSLIVLLGPWGLNHSLNVLIWNASMIAMVGILFGLPASEAPLVAKDVRTRLLAAGFVISAVLPLGERLGVFDSWPSYAVYASHAERTEVAVLADEADRLPPELAGSLGSDILGDFRPLNLSGWSLSERGSPLYPQNRAWNGVAVALAERYDILLRVTHRGRASAFSGRRDSTILTGRESLRDQWRGSWLNAMPAPRLLRDSFPRRPQD